MTNRLICGVDEAGRGPLAGAVFAAAVILDPARPIAGLADSKKLSEKKRDALAIQIKEHAFAWAVASSSVEEIDEINILQASLLAMKRAVEGLRLKPMKVLVDGNRLPAIDIRAEAIVQGDALVPAISAASILAKVHRDRLCEQMHAQYPQYGFDQHKGYGTAVHLAALQMHGPVECHRLTFAPVARSVR